MKRYIPGIEKFEWVKSSLLAISQISVLVLFWVTALNNLNLLLPIILVSILYIFIFRDIFLSFIGILIGVIFASVLLKFNFLQTFFEDKDVTLIYIFIAFIELTIIPAILFSIKTRANSFDNSVKELGFSVFIVLALQLLLRVNIQNDDELSLRYLVPTGEDNAAWLSGLGAGMTSGSSDMVYSSNINSGQGQATGLISLVMRGLINYGEPNYGFVDNLSTLLRIYMVCIALAILLVCMLIFRLSQNSRVGTFASLSIASMSGFSVYLSSTSFAVFGHLPPIQSGLVIFLIFAFVSLPKSEVNVKFISSEFLRVLIVLILVVGVSEAWYPLAPAMWLAVALIVIKLLFGNLKTKFQINFLKVTLAIFAGALLILTSHLKEIEVVFNEQLNRFTFLATMPGGTLSPNSFQILLFVGFIAVYVSGRTESIKILSNSVVTNSILFGLLALYVLVITISITTPPNSVAYAGQKLGLFIAFITLPFTIAAVGYLLLRNSGSIASSATYAICVFLALFNLGPPSGPSSNSYVQFGSPFGFLKILQSSPSASSTWSHQLFSEIKLSPDRTVICFDSRQQEYQGGDSAICSKFATAIQGKWGDSFSYFWTMVNLNAASASDWEIQAPSNFNQQYKVFRLDKNYESSADPNQIELAKYFPIER